jgi:hypothetical protein
MPGMRGIVVLNAMSAAPYMAEQTATRITIRVFFHILSAAFMILRVFTSRDDGNLQDYGGSVNRFIENLQGI